MTAEDASPDTAAPRARAGATRAAVVTVVLALLLFIGKMAAAIASDSIGVVSTAIDAALDLVIALTVLAGVRMAQRPPDPDHPYGHGKFENVAGVTEAGILAATGVIVGFFAVQRILDPPAVQADAWVVGVLVLAIVVDAERAFSLSKAAKRHRSPALKVDTWHYLSDLITTSVVLGALMLATNGYPIADGIAALVVAAFILVGSVYVGYNAVGGLVDRVEPSLTERVEQAIRAVDDVHGAPQVRVRGAGPDVFVDATVEVPRALDLEAAHDVMDQVEEAVRAEVGRADVTVHAEPVIGRESVATTLEVLASREPEILGVHEIFVDRFDGGLVVDCHVEVAEEHSLAEAHEIAQAFEARIKAHVPDVVGVRTHIEPMPQHPRAGREVTEEHPELVARIQAAATQPPFKQGCSVTLKEAGESLEAVVTARMAGSTPLSEAHQASEELERRLLAMGPNLDRVVVHVEPDSSESGESARTG